MVFNSGDFLSAIKQCNELVQKRPGSEVLKKTYWYLGRSYQGMSQFDNALNTYQLAVELFPTCLELRLSLASLYQKVNLIKKAQETYQTVLDEEPDEFDANIGIAQTYEKQGFMAKAAAHYKKALEFMEIRDASLWRQYAFCLFKQRKYSDAEAALQKSLAVNSESVESWVIMARIQYNLRSKTKAIESLKIARAFDPEDKELKLRMSLWLFSMGETAKSLLLAREVLAKEPQESLALLSASLSLLKSGQKAKANEYLKAITAQENAPRFVALLAHRLLNGDISAAAQAAHGF